MVGKSLLLFVCFCVSAHGIAEQTDDADMDDSDDSIDFLRYTIPSSGYFAPLWALFVAMSLFTTLPLYLADHEPDLIRLRDDGIPKLASVVGHREETSACFDHKEYYLTIRVDTSASNSTQVVVEKDLGVNSESFRQGRESGVLRVLALPGKPLHVMEEWVCRSAG